jgi:hypothetical protein
MTLLLIVTHATKIYILCKTSKNITTSKGGGFLRLIKKDIEKEDEWQRYENECLLAESEAERMYEESKLNERYCEPDINDFAQSELESWDEMYPGWRDGILD